MDYDPPRHPIGALDIPGMSIGEKLFGFNGRLRRRDFWIWTIAMGLGQGLSSFVSVHAVGLSMVEASNQGPFDQGGLILNGLALLFLWPNLALAAKRIQDRGLAGLWGIALTLMMTFLSYAQPPKGSVLELSASVGLMVTGLVWLVLLGALEGSRGTNRFGASPKAVSDLSDVFR